LGNANKDDVVRGDDNFDREAMLLLLRIHVALERDDQRASVVATIAIEVAMDHHHNPCRRKEYPGSLLRAQTYRKKISTFDLLLARTELKRDRV
jgi:hypothetical protein